MTPSNSSPRLLFRADGGRSIGGGHVVRCLTLAAHLDTSGLEVCFAIRDDQGAFVDRIETAGYEVVRLPEEPLPGSLLAGAWPEEMQQRDLDRLFAASSHEFLAVIVDHYGLDAYWERGIRKRTSRVMAIDDLANRNHDVDILVDQNWYGATTPSRYDGLVPPDTVCLLGPRYALLQKEYAEVRGVAAPAQYPPQRVLISFGGSDPTGETAKVVEALAAPEFSAMTVDVVLGSPQVLSDRLEAAIDGRTNTNLHIGVPTLAGLLGGADLAFGASGAGTWERMCLDVPAIVTTTSEAHSGVTEALAKAGMTTWAGIGAGVSVDAYRRHLNRHLEHQPGPSPSVVDALGAARVAEALVPSPGARLSLRGATAHDGPQFIGVDPGGPADEPRQLEGPAVWLTEEARFRNALTDEERVRLVVELGPVPIGRVEADLGEDTLRIRFMLDDSVAGRGLGYQLASTLGASAWTRDGGQLSYVGAPDDTPAAATNIHDHYGSMGFPTVSIAHSATHEAPCPPEAY